MEAEINQIISLWTINQDMSMFLHNTYVEIYEIENLILVFARVLVKSPKNPCTIPVGHLKGVPRS